MNAACRVLLVSGSLREGSTNTAVGRTAAAIAPDGVAAAVYEGLAGLPHFNPDHDFDPLPEPVTALRAAIARSDAVLFSTPEYAGALPGSFKNLLDWTVGGAEMYGKRVAWINASGVAAPTGGAGAHDSLRSVLGYVGAEIVEPACVRVPIDRQAIGADGLVADADARGAIVASLRALAAAVAAPKEDDGDGRDGDDRDRDDRG